MKTAVRVVALFALVASMVTAGMAQDNLSADVPFSFVVNRQVMPAGKYTVESLKSADRKVLVVRGEGHTTAVLSLFVNAVNGSPKLVFHRVGDLTFLTSVTGLDHEYEFPVSAPKIRQSTKTAQVSEIALVAGK